MEQNTIKKIKPGIFGPFESLMMWIVRCLPVPAFRMWTLAFFHPVEAYEAEKKNATFGNVSKWLIYMGLFQAIISIFRGLPDIRIGSLIADPIALWVVVLAGSGVFFVLANIMKGKGNFMDQTAGLTLVNGGMIVVATPLVFLNALPTIGVVFLAFQWLLYLYFFYDAYLVIRHVHSISSKRTAVVVLLPLLLMIIGFVFALYLAASMGKLPPGTPQ